MTNSPASKFHDLISAVRRRKWRCACAVVALVAFGCGGPWLYWRHHLKRFAVVRPGVLYRSAQPTEHGFRHAIGEYGVRTIISLRMEDPKLKLGLLDINDGNGELESRFAAEQGWRLVQWPLGDEACWPWPTPWHMEEFLRLFDDPQYFPVLIHCAGGRHRTGTLGALFRLEYDRWTPDQAIAEMHRFSFGEPIPYHELNLRTYVPRPLPEPQQWRALLAEFGDFVEPVPANYAELVRGLRQKPTSTKVQKALRGYLRERRPFALPLAQRLADDAVFRQASDVIAAAAEALESSDGDLVSYQAAAGLIADYGTAESQARLLELLTPGEPVLSPKREALVRGIAAQYSTNRIPYLRPLLRDDTPLSDPQARGATFGDLAVVRLGVMTNQNLLLPDGSWAEARVRAEAWYAEHPEAATLTPYIAPHPPRPVSVAHLPQDEDRDRR